MDVSVIIVSYNTKGLLGNCLASVAKYTRDLEYEIIVVDNASTDGSQEFLRSLSSSSPLRNLKLILSGENGGFAKGNNLGIKEAKGKYILLLNPDTLLTENSLKAMLDYMEAHHQVAVASCQLLDSEHKISSTGGYFPTLLRILFWALFLDDLPILEEIIKSYHPHSGSKSYKLSAKSLYEKEFSPDWVTGAFFFVRREAIEPPIRTSKNEVNCSPVDLLDENIFMYGEELEWCMRFKAAGWEVGYTPATKIIHLERKSSGGLPRNAILGEFRGLKYIYAKHYPGWRQAALEFLLNIAAMLRVVFWLVRLKPAMAKVYLEALFL